MLVFLVCLTQGLHISKPLISYIYIALLSYIYSSVSMFHMALFPYTGRFLELLILLVCLTKGLFINTALFSYVHSSLFISISLFQYVYITLFSYTYIALFSLIDISLALIDQEKKNSCRPHAGLVHMFFHICVALLSYTRICLSSCMGSFAEYILFYFQKYRSLLQNIVSFTGIFCKRDLHF